uniref:Uncharacterized protein n=1 Tax=Craspedostauros australis TaxID=1486917 RepID=A0A7R9WS52_9STRA|mmetsp:Transcript_15825/g.43665  ORF Transcript_15825/g.43665 Transcript_15825/m.43665 type:complete len:295 (+) Transcript_15825:108-992(+)
MPITKPHYAMNYPANTMRGQINAAIDDDSLTPVDKSTKKLQLKPADASQLLIKPLVAMTTQPTQATAVQQPRKTAVETAATASNNNARACAATNGITSLTSIMAASAAASAGRRASYDAMIHRQHAGSVHRLQLQQQHQQQLYPHQHSRQSRPQPQHLDASQALHQRRRVSFEMPDSSYLASPEPPQKKRRFQRRNSKTAAMLFSAMAASSMAAHQAQTTSPQMTDENEFAKQSSIPQAPTNTTQGPSPSAASTDETWDGGVEIAEELVRQLKLRRRSNSFGSAESGSHHSRSS